jgi:hypothetical protein
VCVCVCVCVCVSHVLPLECFTSRGQAEVLRMWCCFISVSTCCFISVSTCCLQLINICCLQWIGENGAVSTVTASASIMRTHRYQRMWCCIMREYAAAVSIRAAAINQIDCDAGMHDPCMYCMCVQVLSLLALLVQKYKYWRLRHYGPGQLQSALRNCRSILIAVLVWWSLINMYQYAEI